MFPIAGPNNPGFGGQPRMTAPRPLTPPRTQYLPGRFISNETEITPGEVPMDGSISFFCTNDLSRIIVKQWNSNGILDTAQYVLDVPQQVQQNQPQVQQPPQTQQQVHPQPIQQSQPDPQQNQIQELRDSMTALTQTIENAFNNFGSGIQQALKSINDKLEDGRG